MSEDLNIREAYDTVRSAGVIEEVKAEYETSLEDKEVRITLGSENGKVKENDIGENDLLYTVGHDGEYPVPASVAESSAEILARSVLERSAETDDGQQWQVDL